MGRDLAQRAENAAVQRQGGEGEPSFQKQLERMQDQFQRALPRGMEAVQLVRDVMTCMRQTPKLAECARTEGGALSILGSAMTCAQLGLRPGVGALGHAWILPFWDNKSRSQRAQLIIGYKGYVDLGQRSDRIGSLHTRIVYENDDFRLKYGLETDDFEHTPYFMLGQDSPGAARLFYAVGRLANGGTAMADPMTLTQMEEHRDRFAMAKTKEGRIVGPWVDHFESMGKKTMLLRLMSLMPKSTEIQRAMDNDGSVRMDLSAGAIDTPTHIDGEVIGEPVDTRDEPPTPERIEAGGSKPRGRGKAAAEDAPPPPPPPAEPTDPAEPMATEQQFAKIKNIRGMEGYDADADWYAWLHDSAGVAATQDSELTAAEADRAIAMYQGDQQ